MTDQLDTAMLHRIARLFENFFDGNMPGEQELGTFPKELRPFFQCPVTKVSEQFQALIAAEMDSRGLIEISVESHGLVIRFLPPDALLQVLTIPVDGLAPRWSREGIHSPLQWELSL